MVVQRPTLEQLRDIVFDFGMSIEDSDLQTYHAVLEGTCAAYDVVDAMPDYLPPVKYPRTPGYRPEGDENKYNAWYVKSTVEGAPSGKLKGKTVVLKDNVCLAGVPLMNGSSTLDGYVPDVDATVVTRILDAGGTIVGKAHCECFCLSVGSHTNATGPVHNPRRMGYSAGGSSCGSGALVSAGQVDMAIGGDQGGSIRMPSAYCGIYGMKATHGMVPYTGIMPIEVTIDHAGPMTANVGDNALLLEVIAGEDVSIPMHSAGAAIWTPIALEGLVDLMLEGNGFGTNWKGLYVTSMLDAHANCRERAGELLPSLEVSMFGGKYFQQQYRVHCPGEKLDNVTGRRSLESIRASGQRTAPKGRIDDCKPIPPSTIKTLANQGAAIDDIAYFIVGD